MPGARTKIVNIKTIVPIHSLNPPLSGTYKKIKMTTGDILKCLCKRAIVDEVLPNGSLVRLNIGNYYVDHTPVATPEKEKVPDTPIQSIVDEKTDKNQVVETAKDEIVKEDKTNDVATSTADTNASGDSVPDSEVATKDTEEKAEEVKDTKVEDDKSEVAEDKEDKADSTSKTKSSTKSKAKSSSTKKTTSNT